MTIKELRAQWAKILDEQEAIAKRAADAGKLIVDTADGKRFAELEAEEEKLAAEVKRLEALEQKRSAIVAENPGAPLAESRIQKTKRSYRSLFGEARGKDNFKNFGEYIEVLSSGRHDPRLKRGFSEGLAHEGGFLVPEEFAKELIDDALEESIVLSRAKIHPMKSNAISVNGFDGGNHQAALFGGISGQWLNEGGTGVPRTGKFRQVSLNAKKLACYTEASNEVIADAGNFENVIGDAIKKALRWYADDAFLNGSGTGQPLGVLNSPSLVTQDAEGGQAPDTIVYGNIVKMFARLHPAFFANAVWACNPTCIPQLMQLVITAGVDGVTHVPVLKESNGKFSLLGKPLLFTEKLPALGEAGDIILVDFSQYLVGLRKEITLDKSNAPGWLTDAMSYRVIARLDGCGAFAAAIQPKNGDTQSWAVALAAR